jgi:hypothetical protein
MNNAIEIAKQRDFSDEELEMIQTFWEPAFNQSWLYLSDELVSKWIGYKYSKDMMPNFYKMVIKNFEPDMDYREVSATDPIVTAYFHSEKFPNDKTSSNVGRPRKYYIITGEAFKNLLMLAGTDRGKQTRRYYIKIENLARDIVNLSLEEKAKTLETENTSLKSQIKAKNETPPMFEWLRVVAERIINEREPTEFVYIMSSAEYIKKFIFKIGRTANTKQRAAGLNCSRLKDDELIVLFEHKTSDSKDLESRVHNLLDRFRVDRRKEFFYGTMSLLKEVITRVDNGREDDIDMLIELLQLTQSVPNQNYFDGVEPEIRNRLAVPLLLEAPKPPFKEMEDPEYAQLIDAINNYACSRSIPFDYVTNSRTSVLQFTWIEILPYLETSTESIIRGTKSGKWKTKIKALRTYGSKVQLI